MLVYRLLHANDLFDEIETTIDGRALELTGPTIDLFYALSKDKTLLKNEILPTLSHFLQEKGDLSKDSLDNIIYSAVKELGADKQYYPKDNDKIFLVPHQGIYDKVRELSDGTEIKTNVFTSPILDDEVSEKTILKHCRDKLKGKKSWVEQQEEDDKVKRKRALRFDKETIERLGPSYETISKIELKEDIRDNDSDHEIRKNTSQKYCKKYGARFVWTVTDESGIERFVATSAHTLMRGLESKLSQRERGTDVKLHIWKLGPGTQPYKVDYAN